MTDLETAIMIKNMARETVRQMSARVKNALREVAVTYSDGTTITTSMAAHLSDADIKNYFRVGKEFNIGSGGRDKMVKVKSVKILNADFYKTKDAEKMGAYKETGVDKQKKSADFLIKSMNGNTATIDWKNGKRETVSKKDLEKLKQGHTWATDF